MSGKKGGVAGMLKLGVVLALYAVAACVGLAFVYAGTEKVIAERQRTDLEASLSELFRDADEFKAISGLKSGDQTVTIEEDGVYAAYKNGDMIGAVIRTSRAGYNGAIKVLTGVGTNGKISAVKILEHSDTPGLGANAASSKYYIDRANGIHFYDQFAGKAVSDPFVPKSDVIAITAATITSRAVAASVKAAGEAALAWFAGGMR
jgi:electron transport complex protein RnfG